jgi:type IV secretory pathway VirB2 component (pilin)
MSMSVGASSNALSYLQSLLAQGAAGANDAAGASDPLSALLQTLSGTTADSSAIVAAPAGGTAGTGCSSFDSGTMAALISLQDQSASGVTAQSPSPLFSKLDTDGDGQISKSEFENALGRAGVDTSSADALFAKLDANGDGSISQSELTQARRGGGHHHHHMHGGGAQGSGSSGQSGADELLSGTDASGGTTQTTTNGDGSSTTTISYADGSTVEMTTPAAQPNGASTASTGGNGQNSANLLEQLIRLQSQLLNTAALTISAVA